MTRGEILREKRGGAEQDPVESGFFAVSGDLDELLGFAEGQVLPELHGGLSWMPVARMV
jgi:hypothetical protein